MHGRATETGEHVYANSPKIDEHKHEDSCSIPRLGSNGAFCIAVKSLRCKVCNLRQHLETLTGDLQRLKRKLLLSDGGQRRQNTCKKGFPSFVAWSKPVRLNFKTHRSRSLATISDLESSRGVFSAYLKNPCAKMSASGTQEGWSLTSG